MINELSFLLLTAASIGYFHTILGPDHYIPFIALSKSREWSISKTSIITFICGLGHVLSSVVIGLIGIGLGTAVTSLETLESYRGEIAAWFLIAFGLAYTVWGLIRAYRNKSHTHFHSHSDGSTHSHKHSHSDEHLHPHRSEESLTFWGIFIVFLFGPCEPLIPILMYPAAKQNVLSVLLVVAVFGAVTISTMLVVVNVGISGVKMIPENKIFGRYVHSISGLLILLCGLGIKFLGL